MLTLRDYQQMAVDAILARFHAGDRTTLAELPTGTGKTVVAAHVARHMLAEGRIIVVAHRAELIQQAAAKFESVTGITPVIEKAEEFSPEDSMHARPPVVVASLQSLVSGSGDARRFCRFNPFEFSFLWVDEAHHATADTYQLVIAWFLRNPALKILGLTATSDRADGVGLGKIFQSVAYRYTLPDSIRDGYLVPIQQRAVMIEGLDFSKVRTTAGDLNAQDLEQAMLYEKPLHGVVHATIETACGLQRGAMDLLRDDVDRAAQLERLIGATHRKRTLVFTVSVAHAQRLAEIINRWLPGSAVSIDGGTPEQERRDALSDFGAGRIQFLVNCMIATEGFDAPHVELVVMARPTKSRPLFAQMAGRATRPAAEIASILGELATAEERRRCIATSQKPSCLILDFVGNAGRHKLISTADLLGGERYDEEAILRAKEIAEQEQVDVESALEEAQEDIEAEQELERMRAEVGEEESEREEELRRQAQAASRAKLVATASYETRDIDAFDAHDLRPARQTLVHGEGPTDKQIKLLVGLGVQRATAMAYGKRQASAVIDSLRIKRCTSAQAWRLGQLGYTPGEIEAMNMESAGRAIDAAMSAKAGAA